jgi:hypothetical protein
VSPSEGGRRVFCSLSEGGRRAHLVLEVWVAPRGEEEFHDAGVTVARGQHERRFPILKERTERKGNHEGKSNSNTHIRRGRKEREREAKARKEEARITWGGQ